MNTFLVIAALMAAIAACIVAFPLMRDRQHRVLGVVVAVVVAAAAAGLYPLWSNWNWHAAQSPAGAGPDVLAMVAKLAAHLRDQPADVPGWLMLGRSDVALNRLDDAIVAYDHAHQLDHKSAEADMGLAEAMSLRAGGQITPPAGQLFEEALGLAPDNPKALLYGGFAAAVRGDRALARTRWEALKSLNPPPQIMAMLDARIADLGPAGTADAAAAPVASAAGTSPAAAGTNPSAQGSSAAEVTVTISIAPALKSRLVSEAPLFVFAREPGSQGPPLAAKRLTSATIGTQVHLSPADSMLPGRVLVGGRTVSVTARVSFSGGPLPAAGDLYGELSYDVGRDGARTLLIDRVAE
jgi:cytochrome c-type biogenesis protein CcmH